MPELPEVETTLRGIEPYVRDSVITGVVVRNRNLRWPVPVTELQALIGAPVQDLWRRAKYILIQTASGTILLHLGMSGSIRIVQRETTPQKHDHLDIELDGASVLRLNDPRRFGCCLLLPEPVLEHPLLSQLGPEPLSSDFTGEHLFRLSRTRSAPVKNFIMDGKVVVGVGNIYASEALFQAGIRPSMTARRISRPRYARLCRAIREVLDKAIRAGGTTLSDFTQTDGRPGYFRHELQVYDRTGEPCLRCATPIKSKVIGQRNSYFCPQCQSF